MTSPPAKARYRHEPIPRREFILPFAAILAGTAAGLWLLSAYVGANTSIPPGIAGLGAIAVIVTPAVWAILRVEGARRRSQIARFEPMFLSRGWNFVSRPTWRELESMLSADAVAAWRRLAYPRPSFVAVGETGEHHAALIGPGGHWEFLETGPEAVPQRLFAMQGPATMWLYPGQPLPPFSLTRRLDGMKPVEPAPPGARRRSRRRIGQVLLLLVFALGFGALALFSQTGAAARVYGTVLSGALATFAGGMTTAYARAAFLARRAPAEPVPAEGLAPDFADVFTLTPSNPREPWRPSPAAQQWLVERRDTVFRIHTQADHVGIALAPLPGSRPGYPHPLDEATLDTLLALAAELPHALADELESPMPGPTGVMRRSPAPRPPNDHLP